MRAHVLIILAVIPGCRCFTEMPGDDAGTDSGTMMMQFDSGTPDSGTPDSGTPDAGTPDSGTPDSGTPDAGTPDAGIDAGPSCSVAFDGGLPTQLFFTANDGLIGTELWMTDGTTAGTVNVLDLNLGAPSSFVQRPVRLGGTLLFAADDQAHGTELWRTDGTLAGTTLVKDINPGTNGSRINSMAVLGCNVLFAANDGVNGTELWISDGTDQGTRLLKDIRAGTQNSDPLYLAVLNDKVLFRANDGDAGEELWSSDGTANGTQLLADLNPGSGNSSPDQLVTLIDRVWFTANGPYVSDGTTAGTHPIGRASIDGGIRSGFGFTPYATGIYFGGNDGDAGSELWRTDFLGESLELIADLNPNGSSSPGRLTVSNGALFFVADRGMGEGAEPWAYSLDAGLVSLGDLRPGTAGSQASNFTALGARTYFMANGPEGYELWSSDGTAAGTALLYDIQPGTGGSFPSPMVRYRDALIFSANDGTNGAELWRYAPDAGIPVMLKDINTTTSNASSSPAGFFTF